VRQLGWCANPKLQTGTDRTLVNRTELACNRQFFDYWEPVRPLIALPGALGRYPQVNRIAGIAAVIVASLGLLVILTSLTFATLLARPQNPPAQPTAVAGQAAPTPVPSPTPAVIRVKIGNTDGLGAYLRPEPNLQSRGSVAWPDGTVLEIVGPDRQFDGKVWRNVRDSKANTGWILKEYLLPAE
jgi:hypothetical protein